MLIYTYTYYYKLFLIVYASYSVRENVTEAGTLPSNENVPKGSEAMPTTDEMTINERRKYPKRMKPHYMAAKRSPTPINCSPDPLLMRGLG
jgi:hypothetical protein